jgi:3-oxoacyl-[acyl-carrier protein] reductase
VGFLEDRAGLAGRTAVVVGGAEGLGDVSLALAEAGVNVAVCDINGEALERRAAQLDRLGRLLLSEVLDARQPGAIERFYALVDSATPRIDIVVNVTGGAIRRPFLDTTEADWQRDAQWNFWYVVRSCQQAVKRMKTSGGGSIINVTTIEAHRAVPGFSLYGAFKSGVASLTRTLALEYGRDGVRINCVAPDYAPTPGLERNSELMDEPPDQPDPEVLKERVRMYIPLARPGTPDDVSNCILFLASGLASYVTGQTIHCDGGTWASSGWINYPFSGFHPMPGDIESAYIFAHES